MNLHDRDRFNSAMDNLRSAFPINSSQYEAKLDIYFTHLMDVDFKRVLRAIELALRTLDSFPTINKLRSLAGAHDNSQRCELCASPRVREVAQHIQLLAKELYYHECNQDLTWTLERVYAHASSSYARDNRIYYWCIEALEGVRVSERSNTASQDALERRVDEIAKPAPWLREAVKNELQSHREYCDARVQDIADMAAQDSVSDDLLSRVGLESLRQILSKGERVQAGLSQRIASAKLSLEGKPKSTSWESEQRLDGLEKLMLQRAKRGD